MNKKLLITFLIILKLKTKLVKQYVADCGKKFLSKKSCLKHELNCKCWKNPKFRTCLSCIYYKKHKEFFGENEKSSLVIFNECKNENFVYELHHTPAHEKAADLTINCPVWELKNE